MGGAKENQCTDAAYLRIGEEKALLRKTQSLAAVYVFDFYELIVPLVYAGLCRGQKDRFLCPEGVATDTSSWAEGKRQELTSRRHGLDPIPHIWLQPVVSIFRYFYEQSQNVNLLM